MRTLEVRPLAVPAQLGDGAAQRPEGVAVVHAAHDDRLAFARLGANDPGLAHVGLVEEDDAVAVARALKDRYGFGTQGLRAVERYDRDAGGGERPIGALDAGRF